MSATPTPCSQSQIGLDPHLRSWAAAQLEGAPVLSVVVRSGPTMTAVNGTVRVMSALSNHRIVGTPRTPARQLFWSRSALGHDRRSGSSTTTSRTMTGHLAAPIYAVFAWTLWNLELRGRPANAQAAALKLPRAVTGVRAGQKLTPENCSCGPRIKFKLPSAL